MTDTRRGTEQNEPGSPALGSQAPRLSVEVVDVGALAAALPACGPAVLWSAINQLQTNLVTLPPETHLDPHVESELDVTLAVLAGSLTLRHGPDGQDPNAVVVQAPSVIVLPAGTRRALTAGPAGDVPDRAPTTRRHDPRVR